MRPTILFVTHYSGMYGANQSMCRLIVELREKYGLHPVVLLSRRGEICDFLDQNEISYYISHFYWWVNEGKGVFQYLLNLRKQIINLLELRKIVQLVKGEKIDLVYSNSVTINTGFLLSRKLQCPHLWHIRETLQAYDFKYSLPDFIVKKIFEKGADKYVVISDYLAQDYAGLFPVEKIQRIYNGIDFSRGNPKAEKKAGIINICMMGIISDQKNNLDALKALCILVHKFNLSNIRLHLIGGHKTDYLQVLKRYITENELNDYVVFHGHVKEIDLLLSEMHLGLMCSRDEAFGRVTVEYMMHGMPVIASNSGANPEIVKDNMNGFIYTLYNANELAEKIYKFANDTDLLKQMGEAAYEYGKNNFSSEQNTKAIYEVIKEVVGSK